MPERDATLDAFISTDTEAAAESVEDERDDSEDGDGSPAGDGLDAEMEAGSGDDAVPTGENEPESEESASTSGSPETEHVSEPAVTTMAWSPDGATCEACETTTMRRWRTDSGFLCDGCVDWERTPNQ